APILAAYGSMVAGLWLAAASWLFFPQLRWVPFLAAVWSLTMGAGMVRFDLAGSLVASGAVAAAAIGAGFLLRRREFQVLGGAAGAILAVLRHGAWVPSTALGWGMLLLAAGFVFLSAGVALNLLLARGRSR